MTISRDVPLHGTGKTVGDVIDAAVEAAGSGGGGGGSPQAGQPTRFLTLTYHHPGNEDGNSVSATTGILIPSSTIAEGALYFIDIQATARDGQGSPLMTFFGLAGPLLRDVGFSAADTNINGTVQSVSGLSYSAEKKLFLPTANADSQINFNGLVLTETNPNELSVFLKGMSTIPSVWTINVQLTPIAP